MLTCHTELWARITKFAPNMHPGILSAGIEKGGHWPWPSRSFWPFWLRILGNLSCLHDNGFKLESPNLHQICILGFSQLVLKMGSLTLTFKVWPSFRLKKLHSTLLLYTDLGQPRGTTRPKRALVFSYKQNFSASVSYLPQSLYLSGSFVSDLVMNWMSSSQPKDTIQGWF